MVENLDLDNSFRLSIKSLEQSLDPKAIHAAVQALRDTIAGLSGLDQTAFSFIYGPPRRQQEDNPLPISRRAGLLWLGLQFEAPLDKFRIVLGCIGNWLDRTRQLNLFAVELPPAHTMTLQTDQAKVLAQLLPLGEALLSPQDMYLSQAEAFVGTFGELTPAAKASLDIMRYRTRLSSQVADDLNAQAMGPFKTLTEKYQHFRRELMVCKQESDLDAEFWQVMQDKAATMGLPAVDAQFLKAERLHILQAEAEQGRQQAEAEAEAEAKRRRYQDQQQRLMTYRHTFEALLLDTLAPESFSQDPDVFQRSVLTNLSASEFNRGRLAQAREFHNLSQLEADAVEKTVLDELYLLSGLL